MDLRSSPIFALINRRMNWLTQRQTTLAHNVSNSDTPGYKPSDMTKDSFRRMLSGDLTHRVGMARTSESHIMPVRRENSFRQDKTKDTYETALAGNAVVLEEQLMKVSETQGAYNLATNLYRKHVGMLKLAIGKER